MPIYFCRLNAPRPTFAQDLTPAERKMMQDHVAYWLPWVAKGKVVALGLVADPAGAFGIGILDVSDEREARELTDNDPAITARAGLSYSILPMPAGVLHPPFGPGA